VFFFFCFCVCWVFVCCLCLFLIYFWFCFGVFCCGIFLEGDVFVLWGVFFFTELGKGVLNPEGDNGV